MDAIRSALTGGRRRDGHYFEGNRWALVEKASPEQLADKELVIVRDVDGPEDSRLQRFEVVIPSNGGNRSDRTNKTDRGDGSGRIAELEAAIGSLEETNSGLLAENEALRGENAGLKGEIETMLRKSEEIKTDLQTVHQLTENPASGQPAQRGRPPKSAAQGK